MLIRTSTALVAGALLAGHAAAKTGIGGCVSSKTVVYGGASLIWYVPDTGEICEILDCGGGRAPPKTTVPGCAGYEGTATYSPSYLPGFGAAATSTTSSAEAVATESSASGNTPSSGSPSVSASTSASASQTPSITSPPVTILTGTVTSSAAAETQTDSGAGPSSSTTGAGSQGSSTTTVPTGGAALPTAVVKCALGVAGVAMGVAML